MRTTTPGRLRVVEALPEAVRREFQDALPTLDKKGVQAILTAASRHGPDAYRETASVLLKLGGEFASRTGGYAYGLDALKKPKAAQRIALLAEARTAKILRDPNLTSEQKSKAIVDMTAALSDRQADETWAEGLAARNPAVLQAASGARGNKFNVATLLASDMLYQDHLGDVIPFPVLRSYSEGLKPADYWAGTYGARMGVLATKLCLHAEELVLMADRTERPIKDVKVGDTVLRPDEYSRDLLPVKVTAVYDNGPRDCVRTMFCDPREEDATWLTVVSTPEHRIRGVHGPLSVGDVIGDAMIPVGDGDCLYAFLVDFSGRGTCLAERTAQVEVGPLPTFDLEVDHPSHRFVLANGLTVSNSTAQGGYHSKLLGQVSHRLYVAGDDDDEDNQPKRPIGLPVDVDDPDSVGSLLALPAAGYPRNTPLTPKVLKAIKAAGVAKLLVRSPAVGGARDGGLWAKDLGVREGGQYLSRGESVGMMAGQGLGEPTVQGALSSKHSGGVAGREKSVGGFALVNNMIQVPKVFPGGAVHAERDGRVGKVRPNPAGGFDVDVDGVWHYVAADQALLVQPGDTVEAGDALTDGVPSPAKVVEHKGVGEGRRYFIKAFRDAMRRGGMTAKRRNVEILARGLINHVELDEETDDNVPGDVIPYQTFERNWKPREGTRTVKATAAANKYLEVPVLHYTVGTKIRPSVARDLQDYGVDEVDVHDDPPPFRPVMVRASDSLQHDPDPITRMYGSGLKKSLLDSAHRGGTSDLEGTSFVPGLAAGVNFAKAGPLQIAPADRVKVSIDLDDKTAGLRDVAKGVGQWVKRNPGKALAGGGAAVLGGRALAGGDSPKPSPDGGYRPPTPGPGADGGSYAEAYAGQPRRVQPVPGYEPPTLTRENQAAIDLGDLVSPGFSDHLRRQSARSLGYAYEDGDDFGGHAGPPGGASAPRGDGSYADAYSGAAAPGSPGTQTPGTPVPDGPYTGPGVDVSPPGAGVGAVANTAAVAAQLPPLNRVPGARLLGRVAGPIAAVTDTVDVGNQLSLGANGVNPVDGTALPAGGVDGVLIGQQRMSQDRARKTEHMTRALNQPANYMMGHPGRGPGDAEFGWDDAGALAQAIPNPYAVASNVVGGAFDAGEVSHEAGAAIDLTRAGDAQARQVARQRELDKARGGAAINLSAPAGTLDRTGGNDWVAALAKTQPAALFTGSYDPYAGVGEMAENLFSDRANRVDAEAAAAARRQAAGNAIDAAGLPAAPSPELDASYWRYRAAIDRGHPPGTAWTDPATGFAWTPDARARFDRYRQRGGT